jgi:hypothetical protein
VHEADDVAGRGGRLVFDAGNDPLQLRNIHHRMEDPSLMSHKAIFSVKLERPHGSIEMGEKALRQQRQQRWR